MSEAKIQALLDNSGVTGRVTLPAGEYEGMFTVRNGCTIDGGGAVLWRASGPVLVIAAENVTVKNLKIQLTGDNVPYEQRISVYCKYPDTKFENCEINGMLLGIPDEEQYWGMPNIIELGKLPAERQMSFSMELYVPADADIVSGFRDITLSADTLVSGYNTVTVTIDKMRSGSLIYGYITVRSAAERKIIISGEIGDEDTPAPVNYLLCTVEREAPMRHGTLIGSLDAEKLMAMPEPEPETVEIAVEDINEGFTAADGDDSENVTVQSGKRIPIANKQYRMEFSYKQQKQINAAAMSFELIQHLAAAGEKLMPDPPDIDGYLFMLNSGGTVRSDKRMIFFGNTRSSDGSVRYLNSEAQRAMVADFRRIPEDVTRMVLLFSIYGKDPSQVFAALDGAEVKILSDNGVCMHLPLEKGINTKTILAVGFEKNDGVWEMIPSGKGVGMSLADICRSYGVTVIS